MDQESCFPCLPRFSQQHGREKFGGFVQLSRKKAGHVHDEIIKLEALIKAT